MSKKQELIKIAQEIREIKSALSRIAYVDRKFMQEIEKKSGLVFLSWEETDDGMILSFLPHKEYSTLDRSGMVTVRQYYPKGIFAPENEEYFVLNGKTYKSRRDLIKALQRL